MATIHKLFQQGVTAASNALGSSDTYYCPICKVGFSEAAIATKDLTLEHVPAKALGGSAIILTCKGCNNTAGHTLDAAVANRKKVAKFAKAITGDSVGDAGRAMAKIAGEQIRVDVYKEDARTIRMKIVGGSNDPMSVQRTQDYFRSLSESGGGLGERFTLTAHARYHDRYAKISDLRTAFLGCTAAFGYKFAFHPSLDLIRQQILRPNETVIERWWVYPSENCKPYEICVSEANGIILVPCTRETIVLPYPPGREKGFDAFMASHTKNENFEIPVKCLDWPKSFIALADNSTAGQTHASSSKGAI